MVGHCHRQRIYWKAAMSSSASGCVLHLILDQSLQHVLLKNKPKNFALSFYPLRHAQLCTHHTQHTSYALWMCECVRINLFLLNNSLDNLTHVRRSPLFDLFICLYCDCIIPKQYWPSHLSFACARCAVGTQYVCTCTVYMATDSVQFHDMSHSNLSMDSLF